MLFVRNLENRNSSRPALPISHRLESGNEDRPSDLGSVLQKGCPFRTTRNPWTPYFFLGQTALGGGFWVDVFFFVVPLFDLKSREQTPGGRRISLARALSSNRKYGGYLCRVSLAPEVVHALCPVLSAKLLSLRLNPAVRTSCLGPKKKRKENTRPPSCLYYIVLRLRLFAASTATSQ